jgi:DNA primase catalytic subunit
MKKIKYEKRNIFPYGEVLVPTKELEVEENNKIFFETNKREWLNKESGWLTKAIVDKIKNYDKRKKEKEKELLKLDIEIEQLKKKLKGIKK